MKILSKLKSAALILAGLIGSTAGKIAGAGQARAATLRINPEAISRNLPLSGVQIAHVRTSKRVWPSYSRRRSKYSPNGIPCRVTKALRRAFAKTAADLSAVPAAA